MARQTALSTAAGWAQIFDHPVRRQLERASLPEYLMKQRWFAGKSHRIESTRIVDWAPLNAPHSALAWVEVHLDGAAPDVYFVPLALAFGDRAQELERTDPAAIIAPVNSGKAPGLLHDGIRDDHTCSELLQLIEHGRELVTDHSRIRGIHGKAFHEIRGPQWSPLPIRRGSAE